MIPAGRPKIRFSTRPRAGSRRSPGSVLHTGAADNTAGKAVVFFHGPEMPRSKNKWIYRTEITHERVDDNLFNHGRHYYGSPRWCHDEKTPPATLLGLEETVSIGFHWSGFLMSRPR
jgi:hypothetical protein